MEENRPPINLHLPARILQNRQQKLNFCIKVVRLTNFLGENAINNAASGQVFISWQMHTCQPFRIFRDYSQLPGNSRSSWKL